MRTTVVHRRQPAGRGDITMPCSRPLAIAHPRPALQSLPIGIRAAAPWSTAKLGLIMSTLAAFVAWLVDATTEVPALTIVLAVMTIAFAVSCHATSRRGHA